MNYGFYLSASSVLTAMHRLEVTANNLANVDTTAFKPDVTAVRQRDPERIESGAMVEPQLLLERLGGGVWSAPSIVNLEQGDIRQTGNPLDIALRGKGFLSVRNDDTSSGLSRDGRLALRDDGVLVQASSGRPVLDTRGRTISLDPNTPVRILRDGTVRQQGNDVATLALVMPTDPKQLRKRGDGELLYDGAVGPAAAEVVSGSVESSAVDPVLAINDLMNATRAVDLGIRMMQFQDRTMQQAISVIGKVA